MHWRNILLTHIFNPNLIKPLGLTDNSWKCEEMNQQLEKAQSRRWVFSKEWSDFSDKSIARGEKLKYGPLVIKFSLKRKNTQGKVWVSLDPDSRKPAVKSTFGTSGKLEQKMGIPRFQVFCSFYWLWWCEWSPYRLEVQIEVFTDEKMWASILCWF